MSPAEPPTLPASAPAPYATGKLPVFQEALAEARRDFFAACRSHLNSSLAVAYQTVLRTAGGYLNDNDRLKAALFLLNRIEHSEMTALAPPENESTPRQSTT